MQCPFEAVRTTRRSTHRVDGVEGDPTASWPSFCRNGCERASRRPHGLGEIASPSTPSPRPFRHTGWVEYTKAVDVWAAGCILAELLGRKPLWPGSDSQHQLELICQCVGRPSMDTIDKIQTPEIREFVAQIPDSRPVGFRALYPQANPLACDLLEDLLVFEPSDRIDVCQALAHPYLEQLHYPDDEPSGPSIPADQFAFERKRMSASELKAEILREIWHYHWPRHGKRHRRDPSEPFADLSETYAADSRDSPVEPAAKHR